MAFDFVVVGLGNPGRKYARTRHNAGFLVVERLAASHGISLRQERHGALIGDGPIGGRRCLLAEPQTFMNLSGESVRRILAFTGAEPDRLVVAHDDLDLPAGRLRVRLGGGSGGQRGVASIIEHLGDPGFVRVRVGIGRPPEGIPAESYVLGEFDAGERELVAGAVERAAEAVETIVARGLEAAMNRFNVKETAAPES